VIRSLEVEDASPTSTALMTLQRWMERIAEKEIERITAKCRRYQDHGKQVPVWVRAGMDERFRRVEQIEQRVQMLLGIFASHGVLPLDFKPAYSVGDLLLQHLDALEQEAEEKGGVQQVLADHFAKVYRRGYVPAASSPLCRDMTTGALSLARSRRTAREVVASDAAEDQANDAHQNREPRLHTACIICVRPAASGGSAAG
jgi:hypothetical protein